MKNPFSPPCRALFIQSNSQNGAVVLTGLRTFKVAGKGLYARQFLALCCTPAHSSTIWCAPTVAEERRCFWYMCLVVLRNTRVTNLSVPFWRWLAALQCSLVALVLKKHPIHDARSTAGWYFAPATILEQETELLGSYIDHSSA
jgi:hypothetical protein